VPCWPGLYTGSHTYPTSKIIKKVLFLPKKDGKIYIEAPHPSPSRATLCDWEKRIPPLRNRSHLIHWRVFSLPQSLSPGWDAVSLSQGLDAASKRAFEEAMDDEHTVRRRRRRVAREAAAAAEHIEGRRAATSTRSTHMRGCLDLKLFVLKKSTRLEVD
jgi:hypothetical protein